MTTIPRAVVAWAVITAAMFARASDSPTAGYSVSSDVEATESVAAPPSTGQAVAASNAAAAMPPAYIAAPPPTAPGGHYVPGWVFVPDNSEPRWSLSLDIPVLQRSTTRSQPLFVNGQHAALLDSQTDLNFPMQGAFDLAFARKLNRGWEIEFGVFAIGGWIADESVPGASRMVVGDDTVAVHNGFAEYKSDLTLVEINLRKQATENIAFLAGFRFGSLDERYTGWGDDDLATWGVRSKTSNALFGFQLGTDLKLLTRGPLSITGMCKAGIYGNAIHDEYTLAYGFVEAGLEDDLGNLAFIGETGLAVTYQFTPRFAAKAFYQIAWLNGVALAPEQLRGTDTNVGAIAVDASGSLFYHGGGLGLEWKF